MVEQIAPGQIVEARLIEVVFPQQTNHYGTLFGGEALALMDKASSEKTNFHVPVRQGQLVELIATVIATGSTSITVEVELYAEDLLTGDRQLGTTGRFVMVALDVHGKPTVVPALKSV